MWKWIPQNFNCQSYNLPCFSGFDVVLSFEGISAGSGPPAAAPGGNADCWFSEFCMASCCWLVSISFCDV